jgi:hypothetical protein
MRLGVDIYSLRFQGWDAFEHLEYARRIGLDLVHFSDLTPFEHLDDECLGQVKARADELLWGLCSPPDGATTLPRCRPPSPFSNVWTWSAVFATAARCWA